MRRAIGRPGWLLVLGGAAVAATWIELTLGAAEARARRVFLPPPGIRVAQAVPGERGVDSARVSALLQAARGANAVMCEMAATTVDGRSGWWSRLDASFRAGGTSDATARDVMAWVRHEKVDAAAVPLLRAALADSDWCVRRVAAPLLARVDAEPARQAMLAALEATDAVTREMAALALGFDEDLRSIPPLVARLRDDSPRVRATAAWALGEIENRQAVRPLIDALRDSDALVRESAATALGQVDDAAAVPALTDLLESDGEAPVRRAAAWALGEIVG